MNPVQLERRRVLYVFCQVFLLWKSVDSSSSCFSSMNGVYTHRLKCLENDTHCGDWNDKVFTPVGCEFRPVTPEQAQKCLKNRTISFIGDSQMMDFASGFGMFLYGYNETHELASEYWRDRSRYMTQLDKSSSIIDEPLMAFVMPSPAMAAEHSYDWQVHLHNTNAAHELEDKIVDFAHRIRNFEYQPNLITEGTKVSMRRPDFVVLQYGLHFKQYFNITPYGENYFQHFVEPWLATRLNDSIPSVWTGMNAECQKLIDPRWQWTNQCDAVEEANYYTKRELARRKLPYFDNNVILRSPSRCDISRDGLHIKMWIEPIRSRMLLNYLCDDDWNWVGDPNAFVNLFDE